MRERRRFEDHKAVRSNVPLLIGLYGPTGCGKTFSALRLATGIQRVTGKEIFVIDTEADRALHYADRFQFRHVPFGAPFGSLDYLDAYEYCVERGAGVIVIDSLSHEHEGPGGLLESHDAEVERLAKQWNTSKDKVNITAWSKPKADRRRLINTILQRRACLIGCFRAKEKIKLPERGSGSKEIQQMGWMPIAGDELAYEMTAMAMLPPGACGVPDWSNDPKLGERMVIKRPEQFRSLLVPGRVVDEDMGERMATWAKGEDVEPAPFVFPSGTHEGDSIRDVPAEYLGELIVHEKTSERMRELAKIEMDRRRREETDDAEQMELP